MANRSDFFHTSAKCPRLPRYLKRMLSLTSVGDKHHDGERRRLFLDAHQAHVAAKLKRGNDTETFSGAGEVE